ncbi:COP9 signalosome complex subunit 3 [Exaiptasia diaphana]|uniref:COP9 signalosome complex subunit 3 n=1 Tax=Exaiptasia diaphana TaxID=2652724 RepID=A0A913X087_EXADI|nr:COP9 signalosome complex subunit 3 [Exaiptasia diaphana]
MIYAALKNYDRALYFFEVAVTCPAMDVSHIMLESYKKFILVSLILNGKISGLPKYTSNVVQRFLKPLSSPYHELANTYASNNPSDLQATIAKHQETFARDNNVGLVKQVRSSIYKKNILRLTKTFLTLSLTDMANRVQLNSPREAEQHILHMIEDGDIYATINQRDGMVSFHDSPEKYNSPNMLKKLDEEIRQYQHLDEKLQTMDRQLAVNPQFVQKTMGSHGDEDGGIGRMREDVMM